MKLYEMDPLRIAFGGRAQSGKDTAVNYMISHRGGRNLKFSDPLYSLTHHIQAELGFEVQKDRYLLQTIGTWAREQDPDVWVNLLKETINENPKENLFVSDVRFPNEFEMLKRNGFYMVKIERDGYDEQAGMHVSETSLDLIAKDRWDHIVENGDSITSFHQNIYSILNRLVPTQEDEQAGFNPVVAFGNEELLRYSQGPLV